MTINEGVRLGAGIGVLLSVLLGYFVSQYFFVLTILIALSLIQSAYSHWCPMMWVVKRIGLHREVPA